MKKIKLTQNKYALVDDKDYKNIWMISNRKWQLSGRGYPIRKHKNVLTGKIESIYLHKLIMGNPLGMQVDHKDHNPLNNRRKNLRICTVQENRRNQRKFINASSIFKGVHWNKACKKWRTCITINRKPIHLGLFKDEKQAALAYNKKAEELFGNFALLNTI